MDLRIGYDKEVESNNPIVVLITVEGDKLSKAEAKRVVEARAEGIPGLLI